ncbi:hypothetical protein D8I24_5549 [Cupriavidus necator H850]|uniref:hypothetical protein n=1 Tax=Cupriavidus necator TaxID=106590 RepID=UPI00129E3BE3|nr:hypothetical protein [Cupriavidus necator]KAI3598603.1 hypothetical protein D8I24_5549 [Cupriavidus necator H850]
MPILFDDEFVKRGPAFACSQGTTLRRGADQSATRSGEDGLPVHSFRALLDDLVTLAYNVCHTPSATDARSREGFPAAQRN